MRVTKFGHACVRLDDLVIDPGMFTQADAVEGAAGILITHEHGDHWSVEHLAATDAPVFTIASVRDAITAAAPHLADRITVVAPGESFEAAGFPVTAENEIHAEIHPEIPRVHNSGYLVTDDTGGGQRYFHPGDALDGPREPVDVLFLPVSAPWARASELIEFGRSVRPTRAVAIHDRVYSEAGASIFDAHAQRFFPVDGIDYHRPADGEEI